MATHGALRAGRPLSLQEARALAEGGSEAVGIARAEVTRARGDQRRARSGYFPQFSGTASYQRAIRSQFSVFQNDSRSNLLRAGDVARILVKARVLALPPRPGF